MPRLLMAMVALAAPAASLAQTPLPGAVQPGQIEKQFDAPPVPRPVDDMNIPAPATAPAAVQAEGTRFTLRGVQLEGVSAYRGGALDAAYVALIGKEVTLADLQRAAESITARYRNDGYVLARALVPAQAVNDGVVRIQVVEGHVATVRIEGVPAGTRPLIQRYADKLRLARPLRSDTLERYLLLMNDLPGVTARATLQAASSEVGAAELLITLTQRTLEGDVTLHNRASRSLGPLRLEGGVEVNSVLGRHERTALRVVSSLNRELDFVSLTHEETVFDEGGKLALTVNGVESRPGTAANLALNDLATSSVSGSLAYRHPLLRTRTHNLYARAAFSYFDGETEFANTTLSQDRIRALRLGVAWDRADAWHGVTLADMELSQGLDVLGARRSGSANLSRANGRSDFTKANLYLARLQSLAPAWSALIAASGQKAFNTLLSPEQFAFGGEPFGRGHDASELVGDSGAAAKIELRYAGSTPWAAMPLYTAYAFYDIGKVWRRDAQNQPGSESASSAGLGLRFGGARGVTGLVEVAQPLTHTVAAEGNRATRVFGALGYRF